MTVLQFSPYSRPKAPAQATVSHRALMPHPSEPAAFPEAAPPSPNGRTAAPIALFLYHRPQHTLRCLQSLAANPEFLDSPLYLFCDGPKGGADTDAVHAVRRIARELPHPRKVLVEAPTNRGLANSVIAGVTRVVQEHGRVVVVEDDLVLAPTFLAFMNRSLHH
jgi:GT2 family glycosyltransferase